jgi:anti-anti-sigma factor
VRDGDATRLEIAGDLDLGTVPLLEAEVSALRAAGVPKIVIDLRDLDFMDSTGLRCILMSDAAARRDGFSIALLPGPRAVQRVFEVTDTHARLPFIDP